MQLLWLLLVGLVSATSAARVVCYWNGKSFWREGTAKVTTEEIKPALTYCTHLIYGFAGIDDDDFHIEPLDKKLDLDKGKGQYRLVTTLKRSYPGLAIYLAVGGNEDKEDVEKYFTVLENQDKRTKFVNTAVALLREYNFDGIDLSWQFPPQHEKYETRSLASMWHKVKKTFGVGVDGKAAEHRTQFTSLVTEMRAALRPEGRGLSIGVLPHTNASVYYDIRAIMPHVDFVNLWAFDMRTPERTPEKADYSAPLFYMYDRKPFQNADWVVNYWLTNGAEAAKLNLGIPTFGRTWKMTTDSPSAGVPPLVVDGAGKKGPYTKDEGMMAFYETCVHLVSPSNPNAPGNSLRRMIDPSQKLGTYAFRVANKDKNGIWVSYEEPETASYKSAYAKRKNLGGVALVDISLDDSRGVCDGTKYPIVKAAKLNMDYVPPVGPGAYVPVPQQPVIPAVPSNYQG